MSKRVFRTFLYILAAIGIVLTVLVAVLLLTPFGGRMAASIGWSMAAGDSGVELSIGSTRGSLVRGITFEDVQLTAEDGTRLLETDGLGVRLGAVGLRTKRIDLTDLRINGGQVLFASNDEGEMLGWSQLGGGRADGASPDSTGSGTWEVSFDLALSDVTVVVRNAASGLDLVVGLTDGTASGTIKELDAVLVGAVSLDTRALRGPISGEFDGSMRFVAGESVELAPLSLQTNVGEALVTGTVWLRDPGRPVPLPGSRAGALKAGDSSAGDSSDHHTGVSAELVVESAHELSQLTLFLPEAASQDLRDGAGHFTLTSEIEGPFADLTYSSNLRAEGVTYGSVQLDLLTALLAVDSGAVKVESLRAGGMGGTLTAAATVEFPDEGADTRFPRITGRAEFKGLELDRLAAMAPEDGPELGGTLGGAAAIEWTAPGLSNLSATFDLHASRFVAGERDLGSLFADGNLTEGTLLASGNCCSTSFSAIGQIADSGLQQMNLSVAASDLAALASASGLDGLAGSGTVEVELTDVGSSLSLAATAEFPDLQYRHIQAGPVRVEASGLDGSYDLLYEAFDSTLLGSASLDSDDGYTASVRAGAFDLAAVLEDSLREAMSLAGIVTGTAAVSGNLAGAYTVTGEIVELDLAARRQKAALTAPFSFEASRDSIRLTEARFDGTFGEVSVAGRLSTSDAIDIALTFDGAELSELSELALRPPEVPPRGQLAGGVLLSGTRDAPVFTADIRLRAFEMAGFAVESVALEASGDSSDVVFDLTAESAESGVIQVSGSVPVSPDSATVLAFDPGREFGVSVSSSGFTLDAGESILPRVRGEKRFWLGGSLLLTGTADSLSSVNGRGFFTELSASFGLAKLSLADTVGFEVADGTVEVEQLVIDVERRHVLSDPYGGRMTLSGSLGPEGETRLIAGTSDLDVGHLARALGVGPASQFGGRLDADVLVEGSASAPRVSFSWTVDSPRLFDVGFDQALGDGTFESGVLEISGARLIAGEDEISLTGRVTTRGAQDRAGRGGASDDANEREDGGRSPEFDFELAADDFRLRRLTELPPGFDRLKGRLDVDLSVQGNSGSLGVDGTLLLSDGRVEGFGLAEPITGIEVDAECDGTTVAVRRIRARSGGGSMDASALVDLSLGPVDPTFLVIVSLESPGFEMKDVIEGSVAGNLSWGGRLSHSELRGRLSVEEATVTRSVGVGDLVGRGPRVVVIPRMDDPRANVDLNLDIEIEDAIDVDSNVAKLSLEGGASVGGTMLAPRLSGSFRSGGGTFTYLGNDFSIEEFTIDFIEAARRDPYVKLAGTAEVDSRSGELYRVTAGVDGYLNDVVPELTSVPPLSKPDIMSLLTFGNTFGALVSGGSTTGSSGDNFSNLARGAFLSSAFGLAEKTLERLLHLDRVAIAEAKSASGNGADTDVMIGKDFGGRLRVNYTTSVGHLSNQRVEVSFELARHLWLETRTNPEGNHAVGLKLQIPFK